MQIGEQAAVLLNILRVKKLTLALAESCTGGLVSALITDIPGSSDVFDRGYITYSNKAKQDMLGVSAKLLETKGAVSAEVAQAMAEGALAKSGADVALSVTGIAGPGGGSERKPVGLVYIAAAVKGGKPRVEECRFSGNRADIRWAAVTKTLHILQDTIK